MSTADGVLRLADSVLVAAARQPGGHAAAVELWRRHSVYGLTVARGLASDDDWQAIHTRAWAILIGGRERGERLFAGSESTLRVWLKAYGVDLAPPLRLYGLDGPRDLAKLIAYVPQAGGWIPPFTVEEFLLLSRYPHSAPGRAAREADRAALARALAATGMEPLARRSLKSAIPLIKPRRILLRTSRRRMRRILSETSRRHMRRTLPKTSRRRIRRILPKMSRRRIRRILPKTNRRRIRRMLPGTSRLHPCKIFPRTPESRARAASCGLVRKVNYR